MKLLNKITSAARQKFRIIGENGERIDFFLTFMPTQSAWMFNVSWDDFSLNGAVLTLSPNCLRGFKNNIPFGLACVSDDSIEPSFVDDFSTGRVRLFLLNAEDVQTVEESLFLP